MVVSARTPAAAVAIDRAAGGRAAAGRSHAIAPVGDTHRLLALQRQAGNRAVTTLLAGASAQLAAGGDPGITSAFTQAYTSRNAPVPNPLPPLPDQRAFVAKSRMYELGQQTLGQLRAASHPLAAAIDTQLDRALLDASTRWTTDSCTLYDLLDLLEGNAGTWEAEDAVVPTDLRVKLAWVPAAGPQAGLTQQKDAPIDVTLPTDPRVVAFRPKKNAEIA